MKMNKMIPQCILQACCVLKRVDTVLFYRQLSHHRCCIDVKAEQKKKLKMQYKRNITRFSV